MHDTYTTAQRLTYAKRATFRSARYVCMQHNNASIKQAVTKKTQKKKHTHTHTEREQQQVGAWACTHKSFLWRESCLSAEDNRNPGQDRLDRQPRPRHPQHSITSISINISISTVAIIVAHQS